MAKTLTASDAVIQIAVDTVFPTPQQLQGFATDDVYDAPAIKPAQTQMGVDGIFSGGFVFQELEIMYDLQANSLSNDFFDTWYATQVANQTVFAASGLISLPAIGKKFTLLNGFLTNYVPLPPAKKLLMPRKYGITWGKIIPAVGG